MSQSTIKLPKLTIVQFEIITSTKYFYKNSLASIFFVRLIGGGGGGGGGRNATTGTRFGGEGGCSGGVVDVWLDASILSVEELVEIGAGGTGGAARPTVGNGNAGTDGGYTAFHGISAGGGRLGRGGTNAGPTSTPLFPPLQGGGTSLMFNKAVIYTSGGIIPAPEAGHCGSGDHGSGDTTSGTSGGGGTAGSGGLNTDPGEDGLDANTLDMGGGSGGGGGYSAGSDGGRGGIPGGGGGGGAYGDDVAAGGQSGGGGNGGDGKAFIIGFV